MSPLALSLRFLQAQPDSRLVALTRDGHEPAFEALVRRYRKELMAYCRRLQPQSGNAEDAFQQTLLQAWRALNAGAEVRDVRPWLYRIAHNVSVSNLRVAVAVPQELEDTAGGADVDQLVEQRLRARAALAGMASLPTLQQQVFLSTTLDGASHDEVANALGLTSGAVRGLIYRARATLRAAAAALMPTPVLNWAIKRAENQTGGTSRLVESLAGGGGAGVAGLLAKGGVLITLTGAVAGGGAILSHDLSHRHPRVRVVQPAAPEPRASATRSPGSAVSTFGDAGTASVQHRAGSANGRKRPGGGSGREGTRGGDGGSRNGDRGASGSASSTDGRDGGSPGGPPGGSSGSSDGGSSGATTASATGGSGGGGDGGSRGGSGDSLSSRSSGGGLGASTGSSDGGSSGSGSLGSGGGTDGGASGSSSGAQLTTSNGGSGGSSGTDGGSSGGSGTSGSGDSQTTSGSH